jgi:hypothetical protein
MTILVVPTGPGMNNVTIRTKIDPKIPRWVLASKVSRWLINRIGRQCYTLFRKIMGDFDSSDFGLRMKSDQRYFARLRERLAESQLISPRKSDPVAQPVIF